MTHRRNVLTMRSLAFLLLCVLVLMSFGFLTGCGTSQVVNTLEAVIASAEVAVATLGATGTVPAGTVTSLDAYLKAIASATAFASTELASTDSPAVKATKIALEFGMVVAPVLPPGIAQTVVVVIQAVTQAVANFLAAIQPAAAVAAAHAPATMNLSSSDKVRLAAIGQRAQALLQKLH